MNLAELLKKYKDRIIAFLILGIPFFVETFLTLNYHEIGWEWNVCTPARIAIKISELFATFMAIYVLFNTAPSNFVRKIVIFVWVFVSYIPMNIDFIAVKITGTFISNDFMFAIFNTHQKEALLIVKQYFFFIIVNLSILAYALFLKANSNDISKKYFFCAAGVLIYTIFFSSFQAICSIKYAFQAYLSDLENIDEHNKIQKPIAGIITNTKSNEKETYVFVIGESVDKKHMGIYGYERQTTPCFEKISSELFVFKNTITAHVFTSAAVKPMILFNNINNDQQYSLIQFFKSAGFKTFWFSNQGKVDNFDNTIMRFGKTSDEYAFVHGDDIVYSSEKYNITLDQDTRALWLDEDLLKYFRLALSDQAKKKIIILHLKGSHWPIDMRYPKSFAKFHLPEKYYDKWKATCVCYYDNSILYTDYILNEVVNELKKDNSLSWMLYLSDHGQDVNDTPECELTARTWPHGYEVPFVVWMSDKYRQQNADFIKGWNLDAPYVTDKTAYSIIDLARMSHPSIDLSNSIFYNASSINESDAKEKNRTNLTEKR